MMSRMDWSKANHSNSLNLGNRMPSDVRRAKKLSETLNWQSEHQGDYRIKYVQETFESCPFETTDEFEDSIRKSIKEQQEKQLNGEKINGYVKLTGGKYRHFNYKDVWDADTQYILWLFWNTPHEFIREQILKSVPISENVDMYFEKITMPEVKKIPTQPKWWQY